MGATFELIALTLGALATGYIVRDIHRDSMVREDKIEARRSYIGKINIEEEK